MKTHDQIYEFMNSYQLGALSTVNNNSLPEVAIIGFGQTKDLELVFGTDSTSRKYKNLQQNPRVAFAIGGITPETIQYEGVAREILPSELAIIRDNYWRKTPRAEAYHKNPTQRYFMVMPTWIRYTDVRATPWDITELPFS